VPQQSSGEGADCALGLVAVAAAWMLAACGGADAPPSASQQRAALAAQSQVGVSQLPQLHRCLSRLSSALHVEPTQRSVGLDCAAGTYSGLTAQGEACALRVDAGQARFSFTHAGRTVSIDWDDAALRAGALALHNLEPSDLGPQQPGVQLTRFTPLPEATTETLALRAGAPVGGPRGLPQMSYLRVQGGHAEEVLCRFGA
jgi:hypothetical protein